MKAMERMKRAAVLVVLAALCNDGAFAGKPVRVAADVMNANRDRIPTTVMVINSQGDTLWRRTSTRGNFRMRLSGRDRYTIRFEQPGCRSKQVTVDTQERRGPLFSLKDRQVRFGVVLEHDPEDLLRYAGPVGHIEVGQEGRPVQVDYDYALIRVQR